MSAIMSTAEPASVKGWCPGALRPMLSGDGLIVRVRPRCGALSVAQMISVGEIAARYGNGQIDLTRRANVQIRGIQTNQLPAVWAALSDASLMDTDAEAEAIRNVMLSPLAGIDPTEAFDMRSLAVALEQSLTQTSALKALPGKFGFAVDGGGSLSLDDERADIRLRAHQTLSGTAIAVGIDVVSGTAWLAQVEPGHAPAAAIDLATHFMAAARGRHRLRMRDVADEVIARYGQKSSSMRIPEGSRPALAEASRLGFIAADGGIRAVGIGVPFGRLDASALMSLAAAACNLGVPQFRLSPWRTLYLPITDHRGADALLRAAAACALVTASDHPLMSIDACSGAPACNCGWIETRSLAAEIATAMPLPGIASVHISGCAKGCARSQAADLVLVGTPGGVGIIRSGTAATTPSATLAPEDVTRSLTLPAGGG